MKKYIAYCIVLFAILFANCTDTTEGLDSAEALIVSTENIEMNSNGGNTNIDIYAYCSWTISSTENWTWITSNVSKGDIGKKNIKLSLAENTTIDVRTATITIKNELYGLSHEISILQEAGTPYINLSKKSIEVLPDGTEASIVVESNVDYTISSSENWCKVDKDLGVSGRQTFNITIAESGYTNKRTATIKVVNSKYGITEEIDVSQGAFSPSLEVSDTAIHTTIAGDNKKVTVTSNISWTATCEADWITLTPVNGSSGTKTLDIVIAANEVTSSRTATIKVFNSEYDITEEIDVSQGAFSPSLEVSDTAIHTTIAGENKKVTVTSNISWTATCEADWITLTPINGSSGTKTLNIAIAANEVTSSRTATIKVFNSEYGITKEIAVNQGAFEPVLSIQGNSSLSVDFQEGNQLIKVDTNIDYQIRTNVEWVLIDKVTTGVNIKYFTNTDEEIREGEVILYNEQYGLRDIVNISQAAFPESNTIHYTSVNNEVVIPNSTSVFGANIISIANENGVGIIKLDAPATTIGSQAFYNCTSLTSITIPNSVTTIESSAFEDCTSLTSITIPNSVTTIGSSAFRDCTSLTNIVIPEHITSIGDRSFYNCSSLTSVYCFPATPPMGGSNMFSYNASERYIYVPVGQESTYKDASYWSSYSYDIKEMPYTPTECTSLSITADDVEWNYTTTTIYYTAITNGTTMVGNVSDITITGTAQSDSFSQNTSPTSTVQRTISYTYLGQTATTTITQGMYTPKSYTVDLNNQWRLSSVSNPDSSTYDGVYESYSNYREDSSSAMMYINIEGYDTFSIYVRSDAESTYDYVTVYNLDSTSSYKMTTSGNQNSGTSILSYTKVTFSNIGGGSHRIAIKYSKDYSQYSGTDRGYVLIPMNQ